MAESTADIAEPANFPVRHDPGRSRKGRPRKRRGRKGGHRIPLPNGDYLEPRVEFAESKLKVSDRTARRLNLPTTYIGNVAYVAHNASLEIVASSVRCRNQPPPQKFAPGPARSR